MEYDIKELHRVEAKLLKVFIEFCGNRNISYFLIGGSALGAVRHKGFIPWDDDIDLGIPRRDYEKLISISEHELPDKCVINCFENEKEYPYYFAKVCNEDVIMIEKMTQHLDFRHYIYIDIFPLDGAPNSKLMQKVHFFRILIYKKLQNLYNGMTKRKMNRLKEVAIMIIRLVFSRKWIHNRIDKLAKKYKYEDSEYIANYFGTWGTKEISPKKYFGDGTDLFFENGYYKVPYDYDNYLKALYNDYMQLPPEEKRKSHHEFSSVKFKNRNND